MRIDAHPRPEALVAFAQGKLAGAEVAAVEEHLLACDECVEVLEGQPADPLLRTARKGDTVDESATLSWTALSALTRASITASAGMAGEAGPDDLPTVVAPAAPATAATGWCTLIGQGGMGEVYEGRARAHAAASVALESDQAWLSTPPMRPPSSGSGREAVARRCPLVAPTNIVAAYDAENVERRGTSW